MQYKDSEDLRSAVLEKGQTSKDKSLIPDYIMCEVPGTMRGLRSQVNRDMSARYKFYDALSMWLGQCEYWTEEENEYLLKIAREYLEDC